MPERFWEKVNIQGSSDCWEWLGARLIGGYGIITIDGKNHPAHRVSWAFKNGPIPDNMLICHHCDNPPCVNPAHLFVGTRIDNNKDRDRKGRLRGMERYGETSGGSKLNKEKVKEIRRRYSAGGVTYRELAIEFKVSKPSIGAIIRRESWAWLEPA